ncbi:MAG: hypothetical protein FJ214_07670 [Ignavibacteria bacterium]|nr:hypothetical protein [Ignavibacteria bacterium]
MPDKDSNVAIHSFTLKGNGLLPVIITPIEISPVNQSSKKYKTKGIWDTGASGTVITQDVVDNLSLEPTGMAMVHTASESNVRTTTYDIEIHFSDKLIINIPRATLGKITSDIGCLIGMDVIRLGDFSITNLDNKTCMSFRVPSLHEIDYRKSPQLRVPYKADHIGRNDPCVCDSGKKYKNCHGRLS